MSGGKKSHKYLLYFDRPLVWERVYNFTFVTLSLEITKDGEAS